MGAPAVDSSRAGVDERSLCFEKAFLSALPPHPGSSVSNDVDGSTPDLPIHPAKGPDLNPADGLNHLFVAR